ncbi:hypothetical protein [Aliivibrio finisterrensis]|uniref:hypothetical protein n=1 Tax=Aliivibrio finisterrensis TaxID=511998 RepID=UPI001FCAE0BF|nr:hypothetical protein [Aliivibrio finisterrensis]
MSELRWVGYSVTIIYKPFLPFLIAILIKKVWHMCLSAVVLRTATSGNKYGQR